MDKTRPDSFVACEKISPKHKIKRVAAGLSMLLISGSFAPISAQNQQQINNQTKTFVNTNNLNKTRQSDLADTEHFFVQRQQNTEKEILRQRLRNFSAWVSIVASQEQEIQNHPLYSVFEKLSICESGGDWAINTGNGYFGGVQFAQNTWEAMDGERFAPRADLATKNQQITVAIELQDDAGWDQWPSCADQLGLL